MNKEILAGIVILIVIIVAIAAYLGYFTNGKSYLGSVTTTINATSPTTTTPSYQSTTVPANATPKTDRTPVLITDPANVPAGTQALVVTYSSIMLHDTSGSTSQWVQATGSGSVDLMALQNSSEVIGYANVTPNSSIDQMSMQIDSATITINGTTHYIQVLNSTVTIGVNQNDHMTNATSAVLLDLNPVAYSRYNATTGGYTYVMSPFAKAADTIQISASVDTSIGAVVGVSSNARSAVNIT